MKQIIGNVKLIECKRLETLGEGTALTITNISVKTYHGKERYNLKFENIESCYASNYWSEKEIQDRKIDLNFKIKIRLEKIKSNIQLM